VLKGAHGSIGLGAKIPIYLDAFTGIARQVSELELFLHASDGITSTAPSDLNDESHPRLLIQYPSSGQALARLKGLYGGVSCWTKHSIDRDMLATRPQQKLQCLYRMSLIPVLDDGPRADCAGHDLLLLTYTGCLGTAETEPARECADLQPASTRDQVALLIAPIKAK
jgi:hypothetical protein